MNRRILLSSLSIFASAALVAGATFAFFSDTETSTGNTLAAGSIDLTIDNTAWYNGVFQQDFSWTATDLRNELFFNYTDLKPGDWEEDTISLHVETNPSWVCGNLKVTKDDDVTCTEPELLVDGTCNATPDDLWDGELGGELNFIFWADDGDNVLEDTEDIVLSGTPSDLPSGDGNNGQTFPIVDSDFNLFGPVSSPLPGGETVYIGKAFCFGELTPSPVPVPGDVHSPADDPGFTCDGTVVDNASQSDSVMGDLSFSAHQWRNDLSFQCEALGV